MSVRASRNTVAFTAFCALVGFVGGGGAARFPIRGESMGTVGLALLLNIATFVWFHNDSERRGYPRSNALNIGFVGAGLLVVPYYLVKSRGFKRGLLAIVGALLIYLLCLAMAVVGAALATPR